jgi:hypothetical protein
MTRDEWLEQFAAAAGIPAPTSEEGELLLSLAGIAAHASERTAAPLTCWLAARAGLTAEQALEIASRLSSGDPSPD